MEILKYCCLGLIIICTFAILIFATRTKKTLKMLFLNSVIGLSVFAIIYFTRKYTGINLNLNLFTAVGSAIFGIPAIIGFLFLNFIF